MQTILLDFPEIMKNFMAMENGVYKNILWNRQFKGIPYCQVNVYKDDEKLCFASNEYVIAKSKTSFYLRIRSKKGFTLDNKGKLNLWFGSNVYEMVNLDRLIAHLNLNWIEPFMYSYLTKSGLERILNGKITNPIDFCKHYLKVNRINASPTLMYKACKEKGLSKIILLLHSNNSKDINHYLERLLNGYQFNTLWTDSIQQAMILGKKVDFNWSENRIKEEHSKWTREIMKAEVDNIPDITIPNLDKIPELPTEFELLTSQRRVFEEGSLMNHCIYTNYWSQIERGEYLAFHIKYNNEEATLGCYWYNDDLQFNQLYKQYNSSVSKEMDTFVKSWFTVNKDKFCKSSKEEKQFATAC